VDDAAHYFLRLPKQASTRRRAVLVITDNRGMRTKRESSVVDRFWEADAVLSGLIVSGGFQNAVRFLSPQGLIFSQVAMAGITGVAEKTGGDTIKADDAGEGFRLMMQRLRQRYSLHYAMPDAKPGERREIKVELTPEARTQHAKARVRARRGYVVPPSTRPQ
jgi:hypothetical protein